MIKNILTSLHGWAGILALVTFLDGQFAPVLPSVWQNLILAVLGLITFYKGNQAVTAARVQGISL